MIKLGLERIEHLCDLMGNPQDSLKFIHIAGTNGKGSVLSYIASILKQGGLKVGTFSSPAVYLREETIKVNGRNISKKDYDEGMDYINSFYMKFNAKEGASIEEAEAMDIPSSFERETALAFWYFAKKQCDIVVLECGMGGLTDATNVVKNTLAAVFTSISMDHMEYLGDSLHNIAEVKSGIIKPGCLIYTSNTDEEVIAAIRERGELVNIIYPNKALKKHIPLKGEHQLLNASLAVAVVKGLSKFGIDISEKNIENGLHNTKWPGRFDVISKRPDIIVDGAHNPGAAKCLRDTLLLEYPGKRYILIAGMYADKDHDEVMKIMAPAAYQLLTVSTKGPRAYSAESLALDAMNYQKMVSAVGGIEEALDIALLMAEPRDVIVIFGTLSLHKDVRERMKKYT